MRFAALIVCVLVAAAAQAKTFRWSSQGDYLSADPHARNEGLNNLINDEIFERLTAYSKDLRIIPALATSWEARGHRPGIYADPGDPQQGWQGQG